MNAEKVDFKILTTNFGLKILNSNSFEDLVCERNAEHKSKYIFSFDKPNYNTCNTSINLTYFLSMTVEEFKERHKNGEKKT